MIFIALFEGPNGKEITKNFDSNNIEDATIEAETFAEINHYEFHQIDEK